MEIPQHFVNNPIPVVMDPILATSLVVIYNAQIGTQQALAGLTVSVNLIP